MAVSFLGASLTRIITLESISAPHSWKPPHQGPRLTSEPLQQGKLFKTILQRLYPKANILTDNQKTAKLLSTSRPTWILHCDDKRGHHISLEEILNPSFLWTYYPCYWLQLTCSNVATSHTCVRMLTQLGTHSSEQVHIHIPIPISVHIHVHVHIHLHIHKYM